MPRWILLLIVAVALTAIRSGEAAASPGAATASSLPGLTWLLTDLPKQQNVQTLGHPEPRPDSTPPFVHFNGRTDGYVVDLNPIAGWKAFSVQAWFRPDSKGPAQQRFLHIEGRGDTRLTLETRITPNGAWYLDTYLRGPKDHHTLIDPHLTHPADSWHLVELRYDGRTMTSWVDGHQELSFALAFPPMTPGQIGLGVRLNRVYWFQGDLAWVRFLPTAGP